MAVITRTNEAQGKSCCDIVKVDSSDTMASYLANKLTEGDYVIFTTKDGVEGKTIEISLNAAALSGAVASPNDKVKAHSADPNAAGYLYDKLTTNPSGTIIVKKNGTNSLVYFDIELDVTELNDVVSSGLGNGGILVYDNASEKWVCSYALEGTFSGTATKVPLSSAIKELLKALYITDATDCGSGGNSIMYKTISIPVSNSCICEGEQAGFSDHYPSIFGSFDLLQNNLLTFAERSLGLKLITTETDPSDQGDGYGAVLLEAMIDEDCSDNNTIFLDTVIQTKDNRGVDAQTNLRCFAVGFNEGQATEISTVSDVKILDAAGNGLYKKVSFAIDLNITASSPFSIKFILFSGSALIAADAGYQSVDEFTLLSARVRYPIKTINLRNADINM
jgi:hypothetical protein